MKKVSKILWALAIMLLFLGTNSCNNEDFLNVDRYSILDQGNRF
ncbi:hypothetical protein [Gaoshiqia sp. Z1-71]